MCLREEVLYGLGVGCKLSWRVGISWSRVFWHVLAWSNSKLCIRWITACSHIDYIVITKGKLGLVVSIKDEIVIQSLLLVTPKWQVKPSYKPLEFATTVLTRMVIEQFDSLSCCSRFSLMRTWYWLFKMNWCSRCWLILEEFSWAWQYWRTYRHYEINQFFVEVGR